MDYLKNQENWQEKIGMREENENMVETEKTFVLVLNLKNDSGAVRKMAGKLLEQRLNRCKNMKDLFCFERGIQKGVEMFLKEEVTEQTIEAQIELINIQIKISTRKNSIVSYMSLPLNKKMLKPKKHGKLQEKNGKFKKRH